MSVIVQSPEAIITDINAKLKAYNIHPNQAVFLLAERYRLARQIQTELDEIQVLCRPWCYVPPS